MQLLDFLQTVVTTPTGHFLLSAANGIEGWKEHWFEWPTDLNEIVYKAKQLSATHNVYFSAHLFSQPSSYKTNVLPTRTIQADLDSADVFALPIQPTVVLETSPGRYQAFWVLKNDPTLEIPVDEIERISCKLTYSIIDCDRSGWPLGHRVRLPDTFNYKYTEPHSVNIVSFATKRIDLSIFEVLPEVDESARESLDSEVAWTDLPHSELDLPPAETVGQLVRERRLSDAAGRAFSHPARDRSEALWHFMCECFAANLGRDTVYWLAYSCVNNKFLDRQFGGVRDLRKDILRAERHVGTKTLDVKKAAHDIRKNSNFGSVVERLDMIVDLAIGYLRVHGTFFHTKDERLWYVPKVTGRPIPIGAGSSWLGAMMTSTFGINSSTTEYKYVVHALQAYVKGLPNDTRVSMLAHYDPGSNSLLLHPSWRDIHIISADDVQIVPNGGTDILFDINPANEPFKPAYAPLPQPWYEVLFDGCFDTVTNLTKQEAQILSVVWFFCILFRSDVRTRPLLAVLGPPGSGKTMFLRIVYSLLYGRLRKLEQIQDWEEFDIAGATNPLVVYDNVDTWERWLPDRLATSISDTQVTVRTLYTNFETSTIWRTAVIALTAHSPKFIREDVADRLLLFNMRRRGETANSEGFSDESVVYDKIFRLRNTLWAHVIQDVQKILRTPKPDPKTTPQFRIKDFSTFGVWVSRALGFETEFISALAKVRGGQRDIVLEEEYNLTSTIGRWLATSPSPEFRSPGALWGILLTHSQDPASFTRAYKNATLLGKKLWVMLEALKERFHAEYDVDSKTGVRLYKITSKAGDEPNSEVELNVEDTDGE